jgi:2-iminoacetate synthase
MDFMDLAKPGLIRKFCNPNAILTFKEYLIDFASPRTRKAGEELIAKLIEETDDAAIRKILQNGLQKIEQGERDICS